MLHQIGVGALGPVFRTYEPTRDRLVAVKVFRLDVTPEQAQTLADELSAAADAGLFHPSVVEPIAAGVEGTVAYRAEEYVAAETLDVALRHYAPAPIDKVLLLITQLAGAIDFARTAGVGHGALHPRDIFVTPDEARATGFGVVEALERVGLRAPVRRPYSAPERVGGGTWGTAADVFSLAAIAYELLTGRRPAGTGSQIGTVSGTTAGPHPGALHAVFVQAMDDDPARRYQTALGFASALDAASRGESPMSTYERGAVGAAAAAPPFLTSAPPPVSVPPKAAGDDFESGDVAEDLVADDVLAADDRDDAHVPALHYEAADVEIPGDRSLFDDEPLDDLGLDAPAAIETERFADEFGVAAGDLRSAPRGEGDFDDIEESEEAVEIEDDRYVAPVAAQPGSTLFNHGGGEDRPARGHEASSIDGAYAAPSINDAARHDEPRRSVLPIALALVFGLLLGGVAVYALFVRGAGDPAPVADQAASTPSAAQPQGAPAKPYSEESVGQPKQQPAAEGTAPTPPVVDENTRTGTAATRPVPAPKEATVAKAGRVVVSSSPRGAGVTVNGRWRGRTPLALNDVPFGSLEVRVVQPGYAPQTESVALSSATPSRTLSFKLQRSAAGPAKPAPSRPAAPRTGSAKPESFTGSIYVDSRPRGARVLLDGKVIGTTPMRIPDVRIGSHIIRLQLDEHSDWTSSTRVVSGQESRVTGSLERIR